jgi:DNA mismatch endonuclease (patch repair protein)
MKRQSPAPTPPGVESGRSANMRANRRRDTGPEMAVRRLIHSRGLRYRCDFRFNVGDTSVRPDLVFTKRRIAVFIDGCFWHACHIHGGRPQMNANYWTPKLQGNIERDLRQTAALREHGWFVIRAWEHEHPADVADRIERAVRALR